MIEKAIAFSAPEMEGLAGLPLMQRWLYLVLRWYMDRFTGRVGDTRGISLQGLTEELYVEPVRGRHTSECGSPSKKAIRSALDGLEKAGLIRPCGNGEVLVFFLPKARRASSRPKDDGHMRGTDEGRMEGHSESRAESGKAADEGHDEGHTQNRDEGHTSRERVNHISVEASAAAQPLTVERLLSTAPVLQLPLAAAPVAEWIRLHERHRGRRAKVVTSDERITDWIAKDITPAEIAEAYCLAVIDRDVSKNTAALNVGFLDIFVKRVLDGRKVSRGGVALAAEVWHLTWEGLNRKADELGIPLWDKSGSEGFSEYQRRVLAAWRGRAAQLQELAYG
ncbi:hypothetical protein [Pseudomonas sp.]|uniref:hypothetical protein n=1 Tax=Pseudomonas sp. TaxID=306 RepID=UPI003F383F73